MSSSDHSDVSMASPSVTPLAGSVNPTPVPSPKNKGRSVDEPQGPSHKRSRDEDAYIEAHFPYNSWRSGSYTPKSGSVLSGLDYAARFFGIMSLVDIDITLDEAKEQKEVFMATLSSMPDRILLGAFDYKRAELECTAIRLALSVAEIKSAEARRSLLSGMHAHYDGDLANLEAHMDALHQLLGRHCLTETEDVKEYYEKAQVVQRDALAVADLQLSHMYEVMGPGCSRWLSEENGSPQLPPDDDDDDASDDEGTICE